MPVKSPTGGKVGKNVEKIEAELENGELFAPCEQSPLLRFVNT